MTDQISFSEYIDPFTGEKVEIKIAAKGGSWASRAFGGLSKRCQ